MIADQLNVVAVDGPQMNVSGDPPEYVPVAGSLVGVNFTMFGTPGRPWLIVPEHDDAGLALLKNAEAEPNVEMCTVCQLDPLS